MPSGFPIRLHRGDRYGRLVITGETRHNEWRKREWEATCDCGGTAFSAAHDFVHGRVVSCGCHRAEALAAQAARIRGKKIHRRKQ